MPPRRSSPFRKVSDFYGDPWATPEETRAWNQARKRKWIESLSKRDWDRISAQIDAMTDGVTPPALEDLDAAIRVGVCKPEDAMRYSGVKFAEWRGWVLMAFPRD